jgi:hypothetical protein
MSASRGPGLLLPKLKATRDAGAAVQVWHWAVSCSPRCQWFAPPLRQTCSPASNVGARPGRCASLRAPACVPIRVCSIACLPWREMLGAVGHSLWRVVLEVCTTDDAGRCKAILLWLQGEFRVNHGSWFTRTPPWSMRPMPCPTPLPFAPRLLCYRRMDTGILPCPTMPCRAQEKLSELHRLASHLFLAGGFASCVRYAPGGPLAI